MSDSTVRRGQRIDRKNGIPVPFTEQDVEYIRSNALIGTPGVSITPIDGAQAQVVTEETPSDALDAFVKRYAGTVDIPDMPNVLTGISVSFNTSEQVGEDVQDEPLIHVVGSSSGGFSLSSNASAQAGAGTIPDIQPSIREYPKNDIDCENLFFYLAGNVTKSQILARCQTIVAFSASAVSAGSVTATGHALVANQPFRFTAGGGTLSGGLALNTVYFAKVITDADHFTYSTTSGGAQATGSTTAAITVSPALAAWPLFKPESHTFTLQGQQVSVRASCNSQQSESYSGAEYTIQLVPGNDPANEIGEGVVTGNRADGFSKEVSLTNRTVTISPTIHGAITLSDTSDTATASVTVNANMRAFEGTDPPYDVPAVVNEPATVEEDATATITPGSLSATTPDAIPTAGLYLLKYNVEPENDYDYAFVRAVIINASIFA